MYMDYIALNFEVQLQCQTHFELISFVYQGTTTACEPNCNIPFNVFVTHSKSHWQTEETNLGYIDNVITPWVRDVRRKYLDD